MKKKKTRGEKKSWKLCNESHGIRAVVRVSEGRPGSTILIASAQENNRTLFFLCVLYFCCDIQICGRWFVCVCARLSRDFNSVRRREEWNINIYKILFFATSRIGRSSCTIIRAHTAAVANGCWSSKHCEKFLGRLESCKENCHLFPCVRFDSLFVHLSEFLGNLPTLFFSHPFHFNFRLQQAVSSAGKFQFLDE